MISFDSKIFGKNRLAGGESGAFAGRTGDANDIKIFTFKFLKPADFFKLEASKKSEISKDHKRKR